MPVTAYKVPTNLGAWPIKVYKPSSLPSGPRPLLVCAVGPSGDTTFQPVADKHGFIYCMFQCMTNAGTYRAGDQAVLDDVVKYVEARYSIDSSKRYLHGCSKGGNLTKMALSDPAIVPWFAGFAPTSIAWVSPNQNKPVNPALVKGNYTLYYMFGNNDKFGLYTSTTPGGPCGRPGTPCTEPGCQGSKGWKWGPMAGIDQIRKDFGLPAFKTTRLGATGKGTRGVTDKGNGRALGYFRVAGAGHCFSSMNRDGINCQEEMYTFLAAH